MARLLYGRPKLHHGYDTLVDPRTMATYRTLAPGDLSAIFLALQTKGRAAETVRVLQ